MIENGEFAELGVKIVPELRCSIEYGLVELEACSDWVTGEIEIGE